MAAPRKTLTSKNVWTLPAPETGQRDYFDAGLPSFALRVSSKGQRSFVLMYRPKEGPRRGKLARWTLGRLTRQFGLGNARAKAREGLERIDHEGADPAREERERQAVEVEQITKAEATGPETYAEAVEDYITRYQEGRRGNATAKEVKRALLKEGSEWRDRPIDSITSREVFAMLERLRDGRFDENGNELERPRPYLANRCYSYLKTFFRWCAQPGIEKVERSPCEGLERPWEGEATRDRVLSDDELKALWQAADAIGGHPGGFLKVLLLTGKRKGALAAMRYDEIDEDGIWTPPHDGKRRTRNKRTHTTPLPALARKIIADLPVLDDNPFVFAGRRTGGHLDPGSPLQRTIQEQSGIADFYFHAVRHTLETKLAEGWQLPSKSRKARPETYRVLPHLRDLLLDHAPTRGAGAGYDHYDYVTEMREVLEQWSRRVQAIAGIKPTKVSIRQAPRSSGLRL